MNTIQVVPFKVDVTPPIGLQMAYDLNQQVDTPIFIRGLVLQDDCLRAVIVACDFIGIYGQTWFDWRKAVATAAGTVEDLVFLHSLHQHDSMRISPWMNQFIKKYGTIAVDEDYCQRSLEQLQQTVATAVNGDWRKVAKIMTAERRMSGLAGNRRMIDERGNCYASRFSQCNDPDLQALPVGIIDPILRTLAFTDAGGKIIVAIHLYATHPMAAYRREMVGQDVPGVALQYAEQEFGEDVFNIYLTGCAGNVTFGKYHLGDKKKSLAVLGQRLGKGLVANLRHLEANSKGRLSWLKVEFDFPLNPEITEEKTIKQFSNDGASRTELLRAARNLVIARNWQEWHRCQLYRLSLGGDVHLLSFPGEVCVEYQLYAQSLIPEKFLACAACGNGTYAYIPTARMYEEGGYEANASISTPAIENRLKNAIAELLQALQ